MLDLTDTLVLLLPLPSPSQLPLARLPISFGHLLLLLLYSWLWTHVHASKYVCACVCCDECWHFRKYMYLRLEIYTFRGFPTDTHIRTRRCQSWVAPVCRDIGWHLAVQLKTGKLGQWAARTTKQQTEKRNKRKDNTRHNVSLTMHINHNSYVLSRKPKWNTHTHTHTNRHTPHATSTNLIFNLTLRIVYLFLHFHSQVRLAGSSHATTTHTHTSTDRVQK